MTINKNEYYGIKRIGKMDAFWKDEKKLMKLLKDFVRDNDEVTRANICVYNFLFKLKTREMVDSAEWEQLEKMVWAYEVKKAEARKAKRIAEKARAVKEANNTKPMINAEDMVNLIHNDAVPTEALNDLAELTEKYDLVNALLVIAQKHSPYIAFQICKVFPDLHDDLVWAIDSLPMDKFSAEEPSILNCEVVR